MADLLLPANLRFILLRLLPSPEIKLVSLQLRISNHLDMLRDNLWAVNALLLDANLRAIKDPESKNWLGDVNIAIMDVENILQALQDFCQQPEEQNQKVTPLPNLLHRSNVSSVSSRHAILLELKQIAQSLNCLLSRAVAFGLQIDMINSMDPNQAEYSSIIRQEVVGRDDDVKRILQIIFQLGQPSQCITDDEPFVIAITGEGVVGKSLLARTIYHHPLVREFFKRRIWVDVLKYTVYTFDHREIARECVRHLTGKTSSEVDVWILLRRSLPQTRFLLVLDNLFNFTEENIDKFEELRRNLLSFAAPGSRVIITCESYPTLESDPIVYLDKEYELEDISEDAWTKLFLKYAIPTMHPDQAKEISPSIGMIDMLKLANEQFDQAPYKHPIEAKLCGFMSRNTLLGFFQFQVQSRRFAEFYYSYSSRRKELGQTILYVELFGSLPLTFTNSCFDMLIVEDMRNYSRNSELQFQTIIPFLIKNFHEIKFEFHSLLVRAIQKSIYHFTTRNGQEFRISQQCRYLCIHVDSNTNTFLTNLEAKIANNLRMLMLCKVKDEIDLQHQKYQEASSIEIPKSLIKNLSMLSIIDTDIQKLPNIISMLRRLRYLKISEKQIEELPETICDLNNLRVLSLSHCKKLLRLPEQIYKLTKLQILRLAYCIRLQKLPKSITRLMNLQVLDIEACYWLKELPEELGHLERLMNLHMIGCVSLTRIPTGISKLINLEALSGYIVDDNDHGSLTHQELQSLISIEQLHIRHLECMLHLHAITSVNLKEKRYLHNLLLHWEWWNMDARENDQLESFKVLDGLQPNFSHLESLEIISFLGMQFPNWMIMDEQLLLFKSLVEIRLVNLQRCKNLPLLGRLHSLASLEISGMDSITCVDSTISNNERIFPSLVQLILSEMPNLVKWNLRCPYIQELTLIHCPALISLYGIEPENKLTIWLKSGLLGRSSSYFGSIFKSFEELEIVGCHEMRQLPKEIMMCKRLQSLSIIRCNKLLSMPNWLQEMSFLRQVFLAGCTTISYIPKKLKRHIIVQGCSKLQL